MTLARIQVERKSGKERFIVNNIELQFDLNSFWQWSSSDLVSNALRGVLAEYIVAIAIDADLTVRTEWDSYDLLSPKGLKIEVKSASYIQTWRQERYSSISFGIQPTSKWNPETNRVENEIKRQADVYVFCLLTHKEKESIDPMNLDQWEFYILESKILNEKLCNQKTLSLGTLLRLKPIAVNFSQIRDAIDNIENIRLK
ncbi:MAG: hypothetical protein KDB79_09460 [Acidobacteria bacterium]|nr:hypothetical protein [Acidobacteriota bacterium]